MDFPTFRLDGKVALVTGSTKGIGYGIASGLAKSGADIVVTSRNEADCNRIANEICVLGRKAIGIAIDVTNVDKVNDLVDRVIKEFGKIDILVNNAGTAMTKKAEDLTVQDYDQVVGLNQRAVFLVTQAVGRQMIKQRSGRIINIASIFGIVGDRQILPYSVAKGGVIQMTKVLALEWAKYNIQVNALCPGYVITPMNEADLRKEKILNHIMGNIPMRRLGRIEDMVGAAVFLASDAASYMTGQSLIIDGGWTAQ